MQHKKIIVQYTTYIFLFPIVIIYCCTIYNMLSTAQKHCLVRIADLYVIY